MSDSGGKGASALPRKHRDAAYRPVGDEGGLVVLPGKAEVKVLNPVGSLIFSLIDGEHAPADIARAVAEEFDVSEEEALHDVNEFLEELSRHGMLA